MAKRLTEKNTKAEILTAYQELLKEKNAVPAKPAPLAVVSEPQKPMNTPVMTAQKIDSTIDNLVKIQFSFGSAVSDLSEKLTKEATQLSEIQKSVAEELKQLKGLHDLEIAEDTLNLLIESYEENAKTFATEFTERRQTVEQEFAEQKQAWEKEQEDWKRQLKERNETQVKVRQRDEEEYRYNLELSRNLAREEYEQNKRVLNQQLTEERLEQEKQWMEREKGIAEREKQFAEFQAKVEVMPQEKEAAIKKAKEEGRGIGTYQAKVKADLYAKEVEGQKQFYELRLQSLAETIQNQESRIQSLSKQLDSALKQVQDLAVKAIEGSSNFNSSQVLKEIALEQAKQLKNK